MSDKDFRGEIASAEEFLERYLEGQTTLDSDADEEPEAWASRVTDEIFFDKG